MDIDHDLGLTECLGEADVIAAKLQQLGLVGIVLGLRPAGLGLEGLLKTMHKGTRHVGKVPHSQLEARELADRLKSLQKKLDKAVADENFEQAALMRDEIKTTREKLSELTAS